MIRVTMLDGEPFIINADLIETIEWRPDTILSLASGRKLLVRESPDEVTDRVLQYRRSINATPARRLAVVPQPDVDEEA